MHTRLGVSALFTSLHLTPNFCFPLGFTVENGIKKQTQIWGHLIEQNTLAFILFI